MSAPLVERGYAAHSAGFWTVEDLEESPDLRWPLNIAVYDRMRRQDPQIRSVVRAVTMPILGATWAIDGAGVPDEVTARVADSLDLPVKGATEAQTPTRRRDRFSWPSHLRHALLMLVHGHSFFEQVYRPLDPATGLYSLRKLGWRPPRTISKVEVAADGGLVAIEQHSALGKDARIPVANLVAYVNEREGGDWLGSSMLRAAYKPWILKDRALITQSRTLDRNGLGVPVYRGGEIPAGLIGEAAERWQRAEMDAGLAVAKRLRGGENSGAAVPHGGDLVMQGVTGTLPDADPVIRYYDEQIARAVLAHFLNLGTETGSWALGKTFADFFTLSLVAVAEEIASVTSQHVVEDLVDINWGPDTPAPRVVVQDIATKVSAEAIANLLRTGGLTSDERLEAWLRDVLGLPASDPDTRRKVPAQPTREGEQ